MSNILNLLLSLAPLVVVLWLVFTSRRHYRSHGELLDRHGQKTFIWNEINQFMNMLQDAIESGSEELDYAEIEVNTGKIRVLQGRLKALSPRMNPYQRGYVLSALVHMGLANNPFILEALDFSDALCSGEIFFAADLSRLLAKNIDLSEAVLSEARLENAKLSYAKLSGAKLDDAKLSGAYLNDAKMSGSYLKSTDLQRTYLIEADISKSYLFEANLDGAIMRKAKLHASNLTGARLHNTNLSEVDLSKAIMKDCVLQGATLSEANLTGAYMSGADLDSADLWRANLARVIITGTNFDAAYLKEAKFSGIYKDLLTCSENELDKLQERSEVGLFASEYDLRFGIAKTRFYGCSWWQASFDEAAIRTLGRYLLEQFAAPNGMILSEADTAEYDTVVARFRAVIDACKK